MRKKLFSFMLMAVGLLISGNVWAVNQQNGHAAENAGVDVAKMTVTNTEMGTTKVTYYATLQETFDDLPTNSYPATITVLKNIESPLTLNDQTPSWTIPTKCNLTLDLNGKVVYTNTDNNYKSSTLIKNNGTLTIKDSRGGGLLTNAASTPDDWTEATEGKRWPTIANNTITNYGTVIVESGTIENGSGGYACYTIDSYGKIIMNGGCLRQPSANNVRLYGSGSELIMNGGLITSGKYPVTFNSSSNVKATFNGGTIVSSHNDYPMVYAWASGDVGTGYELTVNGETNFYCWVAASASAINMNINGGIFLHETNALIDYNNAIQGVVSGGVFRKDFLTDENVLKWIKPGYCIREVKPEDNIVVRDQEGNVIENFDFTDYRIVVPTKKVDLDVNGGEINLSAQSIVLDEMTDLTITPISGENTTINIDEDTKVNKIEVIAPDDKGEAQIVVKDGVTLNVGNGGIVSENDELVFVKVEAGGKLTVGNNGVEQKGNMYPIIIENNSEKSGVYMVSPDATDSHITEPEATVRLYTRAYMTTTTNRWEQFACPVKEVKSMKPIGDAANNNAFGTEVYEWNYATDAWDIINTSYKEGWTTDINLVPFKAYDLINNSLPSEGGITYEFRGKLVGNKDMDLIFPEHGFCVFGNSYTAPIDLTVLFGKIQNDINTDNIDPCVYIYDSKSDRFASVNALDLYLHGIGAADVDFTQIPPQQAFVMNLIEGNSGGTSVDYRTAVWGNTQNVNIPIMAPQRHDISEFGTIASIKVSDATSQDKMLLVESDKYAATYDRGADAEKYMDGQHFNLYASTEAGNLCNIATNDLEGTILTFQAGEALDYELSIDNVIGSNYGVKDLLTNTVINLNEGNTYSFTAQPNSTMERFQVVKVHTMATDLQKTKATIAAKGIYSVLGHYLGETSMWHSLPAGVYVVNGVKMAK